SKSCIVRIFFTDNATTVIYTLSLHDALPIYVATAGTTRCHLKCALFDADRSTVVERYFAAADTELCHSLASFDESAGVVEGVRRSEAHTSELESRHVRGCRLMHDVDVTDCWP